MDEDLNLVRYCLGLALVIALIHLVAPYVWWAELATHFRVQYIFGLVLLLIFSMRLPAWGRAAAAALLFAAIAGAGPLLPVKKGGAGEAEGAPLRVVSANLLFEQEDTGAFTRWAAASGADIIIALEVTPEWKRALDALPGYAHSAALPRGGATGVGIWSRVPWQSSRFVFEAQSWPGIEVRLGPEYGNARIVGLHPPPPVTPGMAKARNEQLHWAARYAREAPGALVIAGDLNCSPWSPYFRRLMKRGGLRDSRDGFGLQATWPVFLPAVSRIPIDHVLVSPAVRVADRRLGPDYGSDHLPVLVDLKIPVSDKRQATSDTKSDTGS